MPAVPLRLRISLVAAMQSQIGITAFHVVTDLGIARNVTLENMDAVALAYDNALSEDFAACLAQEADFLGIRVRYEGPTPAVDFEVKRDTLSGPGTWATSGHAPPQISGLLRKRTLSTGRRARGRMFIPFVPAGAVDVNGRPDGSYLTKLTILGQDVLQQRTVTLDGNPTTLSTVVVAANRTAEAFPVVDILTGSFFATQRRRGDYGRLNPASL